MTANLSVQFTESKGFTITQTGVDEDPTVCIQDHNHYVSLNFAQFERLARAMNFVEGEL